MLEEWVCLLKVLVEVDDRRDDEEDHARGPDGFPEHPVGSLQVTPTVQGCSPAKGS